MNSSLQIDAIRSAGCWRPRKSEAIITQKKELLKNSKDIQDIDRLLAEIDALEWLQGHIVVYTPEE
jgi:hypothetical protein